MGTQPVTGAVVFITERLSSSTGCSAAGSGRWLPHCKARRAMSPRSSDVPAVHVSPAAASSPVPRSLLYDGRMVGDHSYGWGAYTAGDDPGTGPCW